MESVRNLLIKKKNYKEFFFSKDGIKKMMKFFYFELESMDTSTGLGTTW